MGGRIFISWPGYSADDPETGGKLRAAGYELLLEPKSGARSPEQLISLMRDAVGAIVSTDPFTEAAIRTNPSLRVIARVGVGTDSIDRAAADAARVAIAITPGMNAAAVADQTLAMILALTRKVTAQDRNVKEGRWERVGAMTPSELPGKIVGLVGAGAIGREVAHGASPASTSTSSSTIRLSVLCRGRGGCLRSLRCLSAADIVSLHVR